MLAEQENFEPITAFKRLDQRCKGRLDATDIKEFLASNNADCSIERA